MTSVQWSRRFLGLRLFLSLAAAGWSGYGEHIERSIALTSLLKEELVARGWLIANESSLAVLCIEPPPGFGDARSIVSRLTASGRAWVSAASFEGREIIRACVTHGETKADDITELVNALDAARSGADRPCRSAAGSSDQTAPRSSAFYSERLGLSKRL